MSSKQDIDQELENEYNNSLTAKDMPEDIVVPTYIKQWTEKMGEAKKTFDVELDISYGQEERSKLDIFRTKETPQNAPVFIFIHGGYWRQCSKEDCGPPVFPAIRAASFAVLLEYQLAPKATMDEIVAQTKSGVEFVGKRFPESPLYLCGHSAGGHLAAMMMIQQSWEDPDLPKRVKGICLVSGLFDLLPILKTTNNIALKLNEESAKRNSPALQLKLVRPSIRCPVILPVGEYESVSFHNQSKNMFEVLKSHGIEGKYFNIPQCDHFNIISHLTNPEFQLSKEVHQMLTEKRN